MYQFKKNNFIIRHLIAQIFVFHYLLLSIFLPKIKLFLHKFIRLATSGIFHLHYKSMGNKFVLGENIYELKHLVTSIDVLKIFTSKTKKIRLT